MKIALTVTLDIDPKVWASTYGLRGTPGPLASAVRSDVRAHVQAELEDRYVSTLHLASDVVVKRPTTYRAPNMFRGY